MWFKNIQVYRFNEALSLNADTVHDLLSKHAFRPIGQLQEQSFGWVPPFNDSEMLCESVQGRLFVTAQIQEKLLPASVLNEYLQQKVDEIEQAEGRRPGRKEREALKETLRDQLLPKAFHRTRRISAWLDCKDGWLVINASSEKSADDFTAHLREALVSLPITPWAAHSTGAEQLTQWFQDVTTCPTDFVCEADLELSLVQDSTVKAKFKNLSIDAPEIAQALDNGMRIRQMAFDVEGLAKFVLNEKFQIKRIKYQDALIEQGQDSDDPRTDAMLMSDSLMQLLNRIEPFVKQPGI